MRIAYLVEDDANIRSNLVPALEDLAEVKVVAFAETEGDAVSWLKANYAEADLVILDIFLKEGTGLGVLSKSGHLPVCCRVVVLTNSATPDMRSQCLALGAEAVYDKTAELDEFFAFCRSLPHGDR